MIRLNEQLGYLAGRSASPWPASSARTLTPCPQESVPGYLILAREPGGQTWPPNGVPTRADPPTRSCAEGRPRAVKKLFREFQEAGDTARGARAGHKIIEAHRAHLHRGRSSTPGRELVPDLEDDILESYEEHHVVDVLAMELASRPADERFERRPRCSSRALRTTSRRKRTSGSRRSAERSDAAAAGDRRGDAPAQGVRAAKATQPSALKKAMDAVFA